MSTAISRDVGAVIDAPRARVQPAFCALTFDAITCSAAVREQAGGGILARESVDHGNPHVMGTPWRSGRQAIKWGEGVHLDTAREEITAAFVWCAIHSSCGSEHQPILMESGLKAAMVPGRTTYDLGLLRLWSYGSQGEGFERGMPVCDGHECRTILAARCGKDEM